MRDPIHTADNILGAFSEDQVERLTGVTKSQLRYWDRTGFFLPSYADDNRRLAFSRVYSFKDVLALKTLGVLRHQYSVSLQHLRDVSAKLRYLAEELWVSTTLYVLGKRVVLVVPGDREASDAVTGQYVLPTIPLAQIYRDARNDAAKLLARPADTVGHVTRSRFVGHNQLVVAGTRIPVSAIMAFTRAGYSTSAIIHEYPDLTEADIEAAFAAARKPTLAA